MGAKEYKCLVASSVRVLGDVGSTSGALHLPGGPFLFFDRILSEASSGHPESVRELLQWNAEVNARNREGKAALVFAVKKVKT